MGNDGISQSDALGLRPGDGIDNSLPRRPKNLPRPEIWPPPPYIPEDTKIESFNCAGLAFGTFDWEIDTATKVQDLLEKDCRKISCSEDCPKTESKFWFWRFTIVETWENLRRPGQTKPGFFWTRIENRGEGKEDFHVVAHPGECSKCYAKTSSDPIRGPIDPRLERPQEEEIVPQPNRFVKLVHKVTEKCYCCK